MTVPCYGWRSVPTGVAFLVWRGRRERRWEIGRGGVFYGQSLEAAIPSGFVCNLCELDRLVYMLPIPTKQIS